MTDMTAPGGASLHNILFDRLAAQAVPWEIADLVLGALSGADDLHAALAGEPVGVAEVRERTDGSNDHTFLSSVTVAGFRGVGPERTLRFAARPGLTLVVGRNGSGKSSFAEAIELSLTGDSIRWAERNSVWRTGWRNLHAPEPCAIATELVVDGTSGVTTVRREWAAGAALDAPTVRVTAAGRTYASLDDLGLARSLALYRPFLTAADLGRLIAGTPSAIFDALGTILGLDGLTEADRRLSAALRTEEQTLTGVRAAAAALRTRLSTVDDDRARRAAAELTKVRPSVEVLDAIAAEPLPHNAVTNARGVAPIAELTLPDVATVSALAADMRASAAEAGGRDATVTTIALRVAGILRSGIEHHDDVGDGPCPMCQTGRLDAEWRRGAAETLKLMERAHAAAAAGRKRLQDAVSAATSVGADVHIPDQVDGVDVSVLRATLAVLRAMPSDPVALADHLVAAYPAVAEAVTVARADARAWLEDRDSAWRTAASALHGWLAGARTLPDCERRITRLRQARQWLRASGEQIRNERLAPFAEHSQRIWRELRQESNVELGAMTLAGTNTRRRVEFPVSVDGADNGTALGVMSQGELHALGLATFLPRSCAAESPFRFVVIDDPVQSMDPAKVDGLARVLSTLAEDRQVVVFTHDSRLPEAVARLEIDADVLEVVRAEQSVVTIRPASDPATRYLDDAYAVAKSDELTYAVRAPVVAELCRSAMEATFARMVWRNRLAAGARHADIESALASAKRTMAIAALALFDDANRGADVMSRINRYGRRFGDAFKACREGVHNGSVPDLSGLVNDVRAFVAMLA
ncbi:MAG TPA: AAA family ATPase [Micromonosporaceae bacterium]|nr:AAA family ATPase [Micromonosporaceae bacterium]